MKITVFALSTCVPDDPEPCWPSLFLTNEEADKAFKENMQREWELAGIEDEETGEKLPFPDDANEAHDQLKAYHLEHSTELWGQWEITPHTIEVPILGKLVAMLDTLHAKMEEERAVFKDAAAEWQTELFNEIGCLIAEAKGEYKPEENANG